MKRYAYVNGRIVREEKATVSVFDRGLNYGHGVFETVKAVDGKAAYLKEHLERLKTGAKALGIRKERLTALFHDIKNNMLQRLLKANRLESGPAYIRITVTAGKDYGAHLPSKDLKPTVIVIAKPLDVEMISSLKKNGVKAITISGITPALGQVKSLNYLPNVLAKMEASRRNAFEGIFTAPDGSVLEGASTNVFIASKGVLKTPHPSLSPQGRGKGEGDALRGLSSGILPGIMRQAVMAGARANGIKVIEGKITVKGLLKADEAFLTNSIIEVVPLIRVDSRPIGDGRPGTVTRVLQRMIETHSLHLS